MSQTRKRHNAREAKRIATIEERHGKDYFERNARQAGKQAKTKFNSTTGKAAADARWAAIRAAKEAE